MKYLLPSLLLISLISLSYGTNLFCGNMDIIVFDDTTSDYKCTSELPSDPVNYCTVYSSEQKCLGCARDSGSYASEDGTECVLNCDG